MDIALTIEIIGVAIGLWYLYLEYKASFWLWSVGILMSVFYIVIFFNSKFYADAAIYAYYLGANVYGLLVWRRHRNENIQNELYSSEKQKDELPITPMPSRLILPLSLIFVAFWTILWFVLRRFTDSPVPLGDSFTTALSVVAMFLMAKKHMEHWLLWVVVNAASVALYAWKDLYPMACLFVLYTAVSVMGYFRWRKIAAGSKV
ncbi:MAG: nicotinamide riboside transporter PnuC [Bacteroidales bacterium]|nr:nicotinamide riboside transporter PnuC [Bacteroidales bacterium]